MSIRRASYIPSWKSNRRNSSSKNPKNAARGDPAAGRLRTGTATRAPMPGSSSRSVSRFRAKAASTNDAAIRDTWSIIAGRVAGRLGRSSPG